MRYLCLLWFISTISLAAEIESSLHTLDNASLLTQAQQLLHADQAQFQAEVRALATNQNLLNKLIYKPSRLSLNLRWMNSTQDAELALEKFQRLISHLSTVQALWQQRLKQLNVAERQIKPLLKNLDELEAYSFEIQLRQQDKTLVSEPKLNVFEMYRLKQARSRHQQQAQRWQQELKTAQRQELKFTKALTIAQQQLQQLSTKATQLKVLAQQQQQRQSLEANLQNQTNAELLHQLKKFQDQLAELEGSFYLTQRQFNTYQTALTTLQPTIADTANDNETMLANTKKKTKRKQKTKRKKKIKQVKVEKILPPPVEDVTSLTQQLDLYKHQLQNNLAIQAVLKKLSQQAKLIQQQSRQFVQPSFNLKILIKVLQQREIPEETAPQLIKLTKLEDLLQQQNPKTLEVLSQVNAETNRLQQQQQQIVQAQKQLQAKLAVFKHSQEQQIAAKSWLRLVNNLSVGELIRTIKEKIAKLNQVQAQLKQQQQQCNLTKVTSQQFNQQLTQIKPLIYQKFANNEVFLNKPANLEETKETPVVLEKTLLVSEKLRQWGGEISHIEQQLAQYAELLTDMVAIDDERQQLTPKILQQFTQEKLALDNYLQTIAEQKILNSQVEVLVLEAKQRIARQKLDIKALPVGILQNILVLDIDTAPLQQRLQWLLDSEKNLAQLNSTPEQYAQILQLIEAKFVALQQNQMLARQHELTLEQLSSLEQKNIVYVGKQLQSSQQSFGTQILAALSNVAANNNLAVLLENYYQQHSYLNNKVDLLQQRDLLYDAIESLGKEEKTLLKTLIADLNQQIATTNNTIMLEDAYTEIILNPSQTEAILARLQSVTGEVIKLPELAKITDKKAFVNDKAELIFELKSQQLITEEWLKILTQRLSKHGIQAETAVYKQQKTQLNYSIQTIEKQVVAVEDRVQTLTLEYSQLLQQNLLWVLGKLIIIVGLMFLGLKLSDYLISIDKLARYKYLYDLSRFWLYVGTSLMLGVFIFGMTLLNLLMLYIAILLIINLCAYILFTVKPKFIAQKLTTNL